MFAAQILSLKHSHLVEELGKLKEKMARDVEEKAKNLCPL
ncbi:MAG: hypothetical protein V1736_10285 [Pseudomonadota bacterium]